MNDMPSSGKDSQRIHSEGEFDGFPIFSRETRNASLFVHYEEKSKTTLRISQMHQNLYLKSKETPHYCSCRISYRTSRLHKSKNEDRSNTSSRRPGVPINRFARFSFRLVTSALTSVPPTSKAAPILGRVAMKGSATWKICDANSRVGEMMTAPT